MNGVGNEQDDLTSLLRLSLHVCQCSHLAAVHKKGEDRKQCYSCSCQEYRERMQLVKGEAA